MMVITVNAVDTILIMEECNMKLCTIVFPESSSSRTKEYTFKIPMTLYVQEGDILRNINYQNAPMKVVRVFYYPIDFYQGFKLKELSLSDTRIEAPSTRFNNQTNNNMKRNITVSLEEARNWYTGKDQTLRRLALQAYTENELTEPQTLKEVLEALGVHSLHLNMKLGGKDAASTMKLSKEIGIEIGSELTLHMKLELIAKYFNGAWKPDMSRTKYFLARTHHSYDLPNSIRLDNDYCIGTHERVMYPGIVYFQKQEDVRKAYNMLKGEQE